MAPSARSRDATPAEARADAGDAAAGRAAAAGSRPSARRPKPLIHKADFEALLAAPMWSRSTHFALHHLEQGPSLTEGRQSRPGTGKISTIVDNKFESSVDISAMWFAAVVPKRHARRAVTRNLVKRQVREAFVRHATSLAAGMWLVRLRRVFAGADFPSARSPALAAAVRGELDGLLRPTSRPAPPPRPPRAAREGRQGEAKSERGMGNACEADRAGKPGMAGRARKA